MCFLCHQIAMSFALFSAACRYRSRYAIPLRELCILCKRSDHSVNKTYSSVKEKNYHSCFFVRKRDYAKRQGERQKRHHIALCGACSSSVLVLKHKHVFWRTISTRPTISTWQNDVSTTNTLPCLFTVPSTFWCFSPSPVSGWFNMVNIHRFACTTIFS